MPSLDFVFDLTSKFKKQNIDYVIVTLQKGKEGNKLHIFHQAEDLKSLASLQTGMKEAKKILKDLENSFKNDN